jgi:hypothetical protein
MVPRRLEPPASTVVDLVGRASCQRFAHDARCAQAIAEQGRLSTAPPLESGSAPTDRLSR